MGEVLQRHFTCQLRFAAVLKDSRGAFTPEQNEKKRKKTSSTTRTALSTSFSARCALNKKKKKKKTHVSAKMRLESPGWQVFHWFMSCHVIVCNRFIPFFIGVVGGFVAGADPSCLQAKAGCTLDKSPAHRGALRSTLGFSVLLKDASKMQLSSALWLWLPPPPNNKSARIGRLAHTRLSQHC